MQNNIKVVILAGGLGTRLEEETIVVPKPLVNIGDKPILWHIMKIYAYYGFTEFIICLGYKGYLVKDYFANYSLRNSDVTFDFSKKENAMFVHNKKVEPWKITLVDTGLDSQTGSRIKKIQRYVKNETFMLTYGDGVANINIKELVNFHYSHKKIATVSAIRLSGKFGVLELDNDKNIKKFSEKPQSEGGWVNGGFFVLNFDIFDYICEGNQIIWEKEPLESIAEHGQLMPYFHRGFWKCMDTLRDKHELESLWNSRNAPWKIWDDQ